MQVLVLDPALILISIDVVIVDNVYELHFKVEPKEMSDKPVPLEMEEDGEDEDKMDEENGGNRDKVTACRKIRTILQ
jgi:hypothetical protein